MVNPTASPSDTEKAHHYLWRFWRAMPKAGHIAIFDRTWYGRVMVERIEGFAPKRMEESLWGNQCHGAGSGKCRSNRAEILDAD